MQESRAPRDISVSKQRPTQSRSVGPSISDAVGAHRFPTRWSELSVVLVAKKRLSLIARAMAVGHGRRPGPRTHRFRSTSVSGTLRRCNAVAPSCRYCCKSPKLAGANFLAVKKSDLVGKCLNRLVRAAALRGQLRLGRFLSGAVVAAARIRRPLRSSYRAMIPGLVAARLRNCCSWAVRSHSSGWCTRPSLVHCCRAQKRRPLRSQTASWSSPSP
jgi:hypothetical protein